MKSITNFIKDSFEIKVIKEQYKNNLYDFYDNDVPNEILEYINDITFDYVFENLKTYSSDNVINKLKTKFPNYKYSKEQSGAKNVVIVKIETTDDLSHNKEFNNIIKFYNYIITYTDNDAVYIESKLGEIATEFIYNECNGICYHLSKKQNTNLILKNGFRCKAKSINNGDYRNFDERTFLYASNKSKQDIKQDLTEYAQEIFMDELSSFDILQINLNKIRNSKINIYRDAALNTDTAFFCTTNIPNVCINKITL